MASFVVYTRIPKEEIEKQANELPNKINNWFKNNPKRRVCKAELWYGERYKFTRKNISEVIEQAKKDALK
jgi:hypothetical protein